MVRYQNLDGIKTGFLMNIDKIIVFIIFLFAQGYVMSENQTDQIQLKQILTNDGSSDKSITDFNITNIGLPVDKIENKTFSGVEWSHVDASKRSFSNILFKDCSINNVDFSDAVFENVRFKNCSFKNVILNRLKADIIVFENTEIAGIDSDSEESFLNMDVDEFRVIGSSVKKINAYGSRVNFVFRGVEIEDVSGYRLKPGSSILMDHSNAELMDFSNSVLDFLEIEDSNILDSRINNTAIGRVILIDNRFRGFSIAGGKKYGEVKVYNTSEISVRGAGPVENILISNCSDRKDVYIAKMIFVNSRIEKCSIDVLTSFDAIGQNMIIKDVNMDEFDIENIDIDNLSLENVHIESYIYMNNANVKNYSAKNITLGKDVSIKGDGANFKIEINK